jgi:hypothetical protein
MWFKFLRHKKKEDTSQTFEGRFISEEEFEEMIKPKQESFVKKEFNDVQKMFDDVKNSINYE